MIGHPLRFEQARRGDQPTLGHLLREAGEPHQLLGHLAGRQERTAPRRRVDRSLRDQLPYRLAHGHAADVQVSRELAFGRELLVLLAAQARDALAEQLFHLAVEGYRTAADQATIPGLADAHESRASFHRAWRSGARRRRSARSSWA